MVYGHFFLIGRIFFRKEGASLSSHTDATIRAKRNIEAISIYHIY